MEEFKLWVYAVAALVPLLIGSIWYNPKVFGTAWMKATGLTEEQLKGGNMILIFGITYIMSFMIAFILNFLVIHQTGFYSVLVGQPGLGDPNSELGKYVADFMSKYGECYRTFKHGALHGGITAIGLALPFLSINSLFERKGFKYIAIHAGYWFVCLMIMGGIVCQFA